jgi:tetratricopeptide (TPR) repeat protein
MPYSSDNGKKYIKELNLSGKKILDVGAGSGTYRKLFPSLGQHWTALEIWEPYVKEFQLESLYDDIIVGDVRAVELGKYDIAFVGDVLEHMTEGEAVNVLRMLRDCAQTVVVSIPLGHYPQDEYAGNPHEKHIEDHWTHERVIAAFGQPWGHAIEGEIGVYVYRKLKIAVYAISKNEAQFVRRFCESAKQADLILIADTGSTDNTAELGRECGAVVHQICVTPWRFDIARDTALTLIPGDFDVCISLDLDEILEEGWREEIERVWKAETTRLRYKFDWGCGISFWYEKIHHRKGYHWHHPVHEYPRADGRTVEIYAQTDMLLVSHHPDPTKSRGQYMPLLELAVKEDPNCPRNAFYHCRELTFYARWQEAIEALHRYLKMPGSDWKYERCYALRLLAKSYDESGQSELAIKWARLAVAEAPDTREPWVELAIMCYRRHLWAESYAAAKSALAITEKALVYTMDPSVWTEKPYDFASIAAWHLGLKDEARQLLSEALKLNPTDPRLLANLQSMT